MEINQTHPGDNITQEVNEPKFPTSNLDLSHRRHLSHRFGQIEPFFVMESVPDDSPVTLKAATDLRTLSLESPQKSDLAMNKDYYSIPLEALYPNSFDKFYTAPTIGEDVPDDVCGSVSNFMGKIAKRTNQLKQNALTAFDTMQMSYGIDGPAAEIIVISDWLQETFKFLAHIDLVYSTASLPNMLRFKSSSFFQPSYDAQQKFGIDLADEIVDQLIMGLTSRVNTMSLSADVDPHPYIMVTFKDLDNNPIETCNVVFKPYVYDYNHPRDNNTRTFIGLRELLQKCKEMPIFEFSIPEVFYPNFELVCTDSEYSSLFNSVVTCMFGASDTSIPVDISRFWAYQLVCAHFYSVDSVDYIYSANLYRELISYYVSRRGAVNEFDSFSLNGITIPYDYLSAHYFNDILTANYVSVELIDTYLSALLCFQRSLRYVDYFTGAKTRPLAVGDVSIDVNNNAVDVVDVTKSIQMQRFLNAVNRTGRKFGDYIKGIFGVSVGYDYHNPAYLAHTHDKVFSEEVANTGDAQMKQANSVTSTLHNINSDNFEFTFYCDRPSILLGVIYFDVPRAYAFANDRQFFHKDRYDMFNPYFQYVGDQKIYKAEIDARYSTSTQGELDAFGYTLRNMEYKLRTDDVCGSFVKNLRSWVFIADLVDQPTSDVHINPEYVRARVTELDPFFIGLFGYSGASHNHFQVTHNLFCFAQRPMAYQPQILK